MIRLAAIDLWVDEVNVKIDTTKAQGRMSKERITKSLTADLMMKSIRHESLTLKV